MTQVDNGGQTREMKEMQLAELEVNICQQQTNIKSHNFRRKQIQLELARIAVNEEAAQRAIKQIEEQIAKLTAEIANG